MIYEYEKTIDEFAYNAASSVVGNVAYNLMAPDYNRYRIPEERTSPIVRGLRKLTGVAVAGAGAFVAVTGHPLVGAGIVSAGVRMATKP